MFIVSETQDGSQQRCGGTVLSKKATGADILGRYQEGDGYNAHSQWIRELGRDFQKVKIVTKAFKPQLIDGAETMPPNLEKAGRRPPPSTPGE